VIVGLVQVSGVPSSVKQLSTKDRLLSTCSQHLEAVDRLRAAFQAAANLETCPVQATAWAQWRDRVSPFISADIPMGLRSEVSIPIISSTEDLPVTHAAVSTSWLPLTPPQAHERVNVSSVADILEPAARRKVEAFLHRQTNWLEFGDLTEAAQALVQVPPRGSLVDAGLELHKSRCVC
jgi:hypothetical protein